MPTPNKGLTTYKPKNANPSWTQEELDKLKQIKRDAGKGLHRKHDGTIYNPAGAMQKFLEERCVLAGWVACDQLFISWRAWCEACQRPGYVGTNATFGQLIQRVLDHRLVRRRSSVAGDRIWIYDGISLLREEGAESLDSTQF